MVCPSGGAPITALAALMPPAPGMFSITNRWPSFSPSFSATRREVTSATPPGPNGRTIFTGRSGYFCADAGGIANISGARTAAITLTMLSVVASGCKRASPLILRLRTSRSSRRRALLLRRDFLARPRAHQPIDDDAIIRVHAVLDDATIADELSKRDVLRARDILVVDHEHELTYLLGA